MKKALKVSRWTEVMRSIIIRSGSTPQGTTESGAMNIILIMPIGIGTSTDPATFTATGKVSNPLYELFRSTFEFQIRFWHVRTNSPNSSFLLHHCSIQFHVPLFLYHWHSRKT